MPEDAPNFQFNYEENEQQPMLDFNVTRIADGTQFGKGAISTEQASHDTMQRVDGTIKQDPRILTRVSVGKNGQPLDDDGCSDGRSVLLTFNKHERFDKSLNRPKVFGGGVAMTASIIIGTGNHHNATLQNVFGAAIDELKLAKLNYGAHTDENANEENSGCGAIDRAPDALHASVEYRDKIRAVVTETLGIDGGTELEEVFDSFESYVEVVDPAPEHYNGKAVVDEIVEEEKVVKQLGDQHRECAIILNMVEGYTVNQELIRDVTDGEAQAFAVDVWRLKEIAESITRDNSELTTKALLSELVYTLSVAAVLTKGDLPVYVIEETKAEAVATPVAA